MSQSQSFVVSLLKPNNYKNTENALTVLGGLEHRGIGGGGGVFLAKGQAFES